MTVLKVWQATLVALLLVSFNGHAVYAAPGALGWPVGTPSVGARDLVQVSEKGKCLFRCRIRREECGQDNAAAGRPDDVCWGTYATCRKACGDFSASGQAQPVAPAPQVGSPATGYQPAVETRDAEMWPVGKWPEGIAYDGEAFWVAESGQRRIARLDERNGAVTRRISVGRLPVDMLGASDGRIFALVYTDQLVWAQPQRGAGKHLVRLPDYPEGMAGDNETLWILTHPGGSSAQTRVSRVTQDSGRVIHSKIFSRNGSAIAVAQGKVWVVHGERGSGWVTVLDADSLSIDRQLQVDRFATTIAASRRSVYVGGGEWDRSGMVIKLDAANGRELARVTLPGQFVGTLLADGGEVIAIGRQGRIWRLAARDLAIRSVIDLNIGPFAPHKAVRVGDRLAITTHRGQGENGSVVVVSGMGRGVAPSGTSGTQQGWNLPPHGGGGPSFDCAAAQAVAERAICSNATLASFDLQLAIEYDLALSNITSAAVGGTAQDVQIFRNAQKSWLARRNQCGGDVACLAALYQDRLRDLKEVNQPE